MRLALFLIALFFLAGCTLLSPYRPPPDTDVTPPILELTCSAPICLSGEAKVVFSWSAVDNYTPSSEVLYRTRLVTPEWNTPWDENWSKLTNAEWYGIPDGRSTFYVQAMDSAENFSQASCGFVVECQERPAANVIVSCSPNVIALSPGEHAVVEYIFVEMGGWCAAHFSHCTGQFFAPDDSMMTDESPLMVNEITVPANSQVSWFDYTYLPPEVAQDASESGYQYVVLRETFYGSDCHGDDISVFVDLSIEIQ